MVAGATGYIGRRVCERLVANGHELIALVRPSSDASVLPPSVTTIVLREWTGDKLLQPLRRAEVVVDLVGRQGGEDVPQADMIHANESLTRELAQSAAGFTKRFILVSSVRVYGSRQAAPLSEASPTHPDTTYGIAKLHAEQAVRTAFPSTSVILRLSEVYGPGDQRSMLFRLVKRLERAPSVWIGSGRNLVHPCHLTDAVAAICTACVGDTTGTFVVAGPAPIEMRRAVSLIAELLGTPSPRVRIPSSLALLVATVGHLVTRPAGRFPITPSQVRTLCANRFYDLSHATRALGYHPTVMPEPGLSEFVHSIMAGTHA